MTEDFNNNNIYWYSTPHECVDFNQIVMPTICKEIYLNNDFYIVTLTPVNSHDHHVVVCNKKLERGSVYNLDINTSIVYEDVIDDNKVIFFDLIYPLTYFYGNSWANKSKKLTNVRIVDVYDIDEIWSEKAMNYIQYYN